MLLDECNAFYEHGRYFLICDKFRRYFIMVCLRLFASGALYICGVFNYRMNVMKGWSIVNLIWDCPVLWRIYLEAIALLLSHKSCDGCFVLSLS